MNPSSKYSLDPIRPLLNLQKKLFGQSIWRVVGGKGSTSGPETPLTPDGPDVFGARGGVEEAGVVGPEVSGCSCCCIKSIQFGQA